MVTLSISFPILSDSVQVQLNFSVSENKLKVLLNM